MDYLFDFPKTKPTNFAIVVALDKLLKQAHITSLNSPQVAADEVAESFFHKVSKRQGVSRETIFDRYSRFTTTFWAEWMKWLQTRLNF